MDNLCCPVCKSNLEIKNTFLHCNRCLKDYEVVNGIPVLVDLNSLPSHLEGQVRYFEKSYLIENNDYVLEEWHKSYLRRFDKEFPNVRGKRILDCGAGSGYMSVELAKRGALVTSCDLTFKGLKKLKVVSDGFGFDIQIVCCTAENLPFKDEYFISNAVLEHLPLEEEAIEEVNRVCKNGAGLMIAVPLSYKYLNPILIPINYIHDKNIGHLRRYDEDTLKEKFKEWRIKSIYYTGHTVKVLKTLTNKISKIFSDLNIEKQDTIREKKKIWASNIICFMKKKVPK